jgi:hypothetical protein
MGVGAAIQLGSWLHLRWSRGRYARDVAYGVFLSGGHVRLVLQLLWSCAIWPLGIALWFLPRGVIKNIFPEEFKKGQAAIRGRCLECGELLDGRHEHATGEPPDAFGGGAA